MIPYNEFFHLRDERLSRITNKLYDNIDIRASYIQVVFDKYKPDLVIHLASMPNQKIVSTDPTLAANTMIEGLINVCEQARTHNVKRFVYISSSMVYGDFVDGIKEDAICSPKGLYGVLKFAGEKIVEDYGRSGCFEHVIIRPSAVYGPHDIQDRVISKFIIAALKNKTLKVKGPDERLDFTYVEDTASGIVGASLSDATIGKIYNITRGCSRSLMEAAELAVRIAGTGKIEIEEHDKSFPKRGSLNIDAARNDFGFAPKIDIEEGFQKYYDYLTHNSFWS